MVCKKLTQSVLSCNWSNDLKLKIKIVYKRTIGYVF